MLRNLLLVILGVVVLLVAALFIVPSLIPADVYRAAIEDNAEAALNRDVEIAGSVRAGVLPGVYARAEDVTIANAEGFENDAFATLGALRANLALLPLLTGRVEITEFVLDNPTITLEVAPDGRNNWTFAEGGAAASGSGEAPRQPGALPFDAALGDVRIVNGRATYDDRASGERHTASEINLRAGMPALSAPISVEGGFLLDGEPVSLDLRLDSLRSFFEGEVSPFTANVDAGVAVVEVDGEFVAGETLEFAGDVRLASNDVKALAARVGAELPSGDIYNQFDVSGRARGTVDRVAFENAVIVFDDIRGSGSFNADFTGDRPLVTGDLAFGALNVTPYMQSSTGTTGATGGGGGVPAWSEQPLNLAVLNAIDADFTASADSISADRFEFGRSNLTAQVRNGRLQIDIDELNAYQGSGAAEFVVDASGATPQVSMTADLANIQAEPFLNAAARFSRLAGAGGGRITLTGAGASQAEIMRSLDGSGNFAFDNGTLRGIDVAQAMSDLEQVLQGRLQVNAFGRNAATTFTDLAGQFTVEDGVARVRDFVVEVDDVRVPISGALDIGNQSVEVSLRPRRVGADTDTLTGFGVPLKLSGSWGSISAGVDQDALSQLVADLARAELEDELGGALDDAIGDSDAGNVLRDALGLPRRQAPAPADDGAATDAEAEDGAAEEPEEPDPAQRLLQGLFGNQGEDDDQ